MSELGAAAPLIEAATAPMIEVAAVSKTFDRGRVHALRGVDLQVARGEFVAITGASGSGKSTLLHLLAALDVADSGTLFVDGHDLRRLRHPDRYRRRVIGLVFQLHDLLPHLDACQNVEIAMFATHRSRRRRDRDAQALLDSVGLGNLARRRPPELSGGERQRVAIARALANEPPVLLADEPTGNLDPAAAVHVLELFTRLREERGLTIVLVTHDATVAVAADRSVVIVDGCAVQGE